MRGIAPLRWSTVVRHHEEDNRGRRHYVREYLARLGKKRQAIVEHLLRHDGTATVEELVEEFGTRGERSRSRDFVRRQLTPLTDPAVISIAGDNVALAPDWHQALEDHRKIAGEPEAEKLQRERHRLQREGFRQRDQVEPDPTPEPQGMDDMRQPWSMHPIVCACGKCSAPFGRVIGDHVEGCCCKDCFKERRTGKPRRVPYLRLVENDPPPDDWRDHPLSCACTDCVSPEPRYARPN